MNFARYPPRGEVLKGASIGLPLFFTPPLPPTSLRDRHRRRLLLFSTTDPPHGLFQEEKSSAKKGKKERTFTDHEWKNCRSKKGGKFAFLERKRRKDSRSPGQQIVSILQKIDNKSYKNKKPRPRHRWGVFVRTTDCGNKKWLIAFISGVVAVAAVTRGGGGKVRRKKEHQSRTPKTFPTPSPVSPTCGFPLFSHTSCQRFRVAAQLGQTSS